MELENLIPAGYTAKLKELRRLEKEVEDMEKAFKDTLKYEMSIHNIIEIKVDGVKLRYIDAYTREDFDKKRFALEHPIQYKNYLKTTEVKDSLRATIE